MAEDRPVNSSTEGSADAAFFGNTNDLVALITLILGLTSLALCFSLNYGIYCLPVVVLALGIITLATAKSSLKPERSRQYGWISVGIGSALILLVLLVCVCLAILYGAVFASALSNAPIPRR
jgi:hypothetical protein